MINQGPNNGTTERLGTTSTTGSSTLGDTASRVKDEASTKMNQLGSMAKEKAGEAVHYVRERGFRGITNDISDAATRNPLGAVAVSVGVGYLLGRLMTRK
jgi:ElaB/YqjD/DUF883 family membrane-anchored ribosome-binding protein